MKYYVNTNYDEAVMFFIYKTDGKRSWRVVIDKIDGACYNHGWRKEPPATMKYINKGVNVWKVLKEIPEQEVFTLML